MVRWYQQRKPVDLIQACRDEADAARPPAFEHPAKSLKTGGWIAPSNPVYSIYNADGQECVRL